MTTTLTESRPPASRAEQYKLICQQLDEAAPRLQEHLPPSVSWERFRGVVLTALRRNPDLMTASSRSLLEACMQCASDGLLPDGREAALTVFRTREGTTVGYMPMIYGLVRLALQSGVVRNWESRVVREGDEFEVILGTTSSIRHVPNLHSRGKMIAVYSIIEMTNGAKTFDVLTSDEIREVRAKSRADTFWKVNEEGMARTVVMRRHAKYLRAVCTSLARVMDRLNEIEYPQQAAPPAGPKKRITLNDIASPASAPPGQQDVVPIEAPPVGAPIEDDKPADPIGIAMQRGWEDAKRGVLRRAVPPEYREDVRKDEADAWLSGYDQYVGAHA